MTIGWGNLVVVNLLQKNCLQRRLPLAQKRPLLARFMLALLKLLPFLVLKHNLLAKIKVVHMVRIKRHSYLICPNISLNLSFICMTKVFCRELVLSHGENQKTLIFDSYIFISEPIFHLYDKAGRLAGASQEKNKATGGHLTVRLKKKLVLKVEALLKLKLLMTKLSPSKHLVFHLAKQSKIKGHLVARELRLIGLLLKTILREAARKKQQNTLQILCKQKVQWVSHLDCRKKIQRQIPNLLWLVIKLALV